MWHETFKILSTHKQIFTEKKTNFVKSMYFSQRSEYKIKNLIINRKYIIKFSF